MYKIAQDAQGNDDVCVMDIIDEVSYIANNGIIPSLWNAGNR